MRWSFVVASVLAASCSSTTGVTPSTTQPSSEPAVVERVVDGDTLIAIVGGARLRVRLIGVDTPETVKPNAPVGCYGPQASAFAKHELTGAHITLTYDVRRLDRFGRTLAYVYRGSESFNLTLVQRGYAVALTIAPDVAHASEFIAAQRAARAARRGLWGACPRSD